MLSQCLPSSDHRSPARYFLLLLQNLELRPQLLKLLYLEDRVRLSQINYRAMNVLDTAVAAARVHAAHLHEEESALEVEGRNIEEQVRVEKFLVFSGW